VDDTSCYAIEDLNIRQVVLKECVDRSRLLFQQIALPVVVVGKTNENIEDGRYIYNWGLPLGRDTRLTVWGKRVVWRMRVRWYGKPPSTTWLFLGKGPTVLFVRI
jgi:hypothetical protein